MGNELIELVAADVHAAWIETKRAQGITSRPSAEGIEQMVPYDQLPDHLQELDRATVRAVLASRELQQRIGRADSNDVKAALIEWAAPDRGLGWDGYPDLARHAEEIVDFLSDRGLAS